MSNIFDAIVYESVVSFVEATKAKSDAYFGIHYTNLDPPTFEIKTGSKFHKIIRTSRSGVSRSVFAFVDKVTGDIFKPASWAAPAKHARGNVLNLDNGSSAVTPNGQGIFYLK